MIKIVMNVNVELNLDAFHNEYIMDDLVHSIKNDNQDMLELVRNQLKMRLDNKELTSEDIIDIRNIRIVNRTIDSNENDLVLLEESQ